MRYNESLNKALHKLMKVNDKIIILGEDILDPYGGAFKVTKGLSTSYPDRVLTTPISEAAITGFATGLAMKGYKPILEIMFGDFITLCADQIINGATKFNFMYGGKFNVPLVIRTPMGGRRGYGATHSQTLEALFLSVSGLNIIAPSNFHNPGNLLYETILNVKDPTLFIENKILYPKNLIVVDDDKRVENFYYSEINNTNENCPTVSLQIETDIDPDITLIAYGGMATLATKAALNTYLEEEIVVNILIPSLVKPFPVNDILPSVEKSGKVIIIEEGARTAGWGAELACRISENSFDYLETPIVRIGAKDYPIPSSINLEKLVLPQVNDIEKIIRNMIK